MLVVVGRSILEEDDEITKPFVQKSMEIPALAEYLLGALPWLAEEKDYSAIDASDILRYIPRHHPELVKLAQETNQAYDTEFPDVDAPLFMIEEVTGYYLVLTYDTHNTETLVTEENLSNTSVLPPPVVRTHP